MEVYYQKKTEIGRKGWKWRKRKQSEVKRETQKREEGKEKQRMKEMEIGRIVKKRRGTVRKAKLVRKIKRSGLKKD